MLITHTSAATATAYTFLASLECKDNLILYPDPVQEIAKRCKNMQKDFYTFWREGNDPFPTCLSENVKTEILERLGSGNWSGIILNERKRKEWIAKFIGELQKDVDKGNLSQFRIRKFKDKIIRYGYIFFGKIV